jgi:hypothetical protein
MQFLKEAGDAGVLPSGICINLKSQFGDKWAGWIFVRFNQRASKSANRSGHFFPRSEGFPQVIRLE